MSDILLDVKNLNIVYSTSDGVVYALNDANLQIKRCLLYTSPSPRDRTRSRMPSSA